MSEKGKVLSVPNGIMTKEDKERMSLNVYDQTFISRVLDFHYEAILERLQEKVAEAINTKYDEQTKALAQVIVEHHQHHMREVDKLVKLIRGANKRISSISAKVDCHTKDIEKIKKIIAEMHKVKIDS